MTTSLRSCGTSPPSLQEVNSVVSLSKTSTSKPLTPLPGFHQCLELLLAAAWRRLL